MNEKQNEYPETGKRVGNISSPAFSTLSPREVLVDKYSRRVYELLSPGGTPRKIGWGCAARFPKPLPYL